MRIVHSSGRYDRPLVELGKALDAYAGEVDADVVLLTEQDGTDRAREALYTAHGWAWFRARRRGAGECSVLWRHETTYTLGEPAARRLTAMTYKRVTGRPAAPVHAATVALRDRFLGPTVLVSVAHLPVRNTALRRLVWRRAMRGWARVIREELDRYPGARLVLSADFNVNVDDAAGARLVEEFLGGLPGRLVVPRRAGEAGTHGRRVIDAAWSDLPAARAHVIDDDKSSDHRPFLVTSTPAR